MDFERRAKVQQITTALEHSDYVFVRSLAQHQSPARVRNQLVQQLVKTSAVKSHKSNGSS